MGKKENKPFETVTATEPEISSEESQRRFRLANLRNSDGKLDIKPFLTKNNLIKTAIAFFILILFFQCFVIVGSGKSGVVVTMGKVKEEILTEGLHFKIPFVQEVVQMDNRTKKIDKDGSGASKDLQIVTYEVAVNYKVTNSSSANLYRGVGKDFEDIIIAPAIQESIKATTAQFTAEQLITQRQLVSEMMRDSLAGKINSYGITVEVFNIVNFDFSKEFNAAVEAKQTAEQNALKAQQDLARIEIEAKQKVVQAQAESESIRLIQMTLASSPEYIDYIKWNKWNGVLPLYMGDGTSILDLSKLTGK